MVASLSKISFWYTTCYELLSCCVVILGPLLSPLTPVTSLESPCRADYRSGEGGQDRTSFGYNMLHLSPPPLPTPPPSTTADTDGARTNGWKMFSRSSPQREIQKKTREGQKIKVPSNSQSSYRLVNDRRLLGCVQDVR